MKDKKQLILVGLCLVCLVWATAATTIAITSRGTTPPATPNSTGAPASKEEAPAPSETPAPPSEPAPASQTVQEAAAPASQPAPAQDPAPQTGSAQSAQSSSASSAKPVYTPSQTAPAAPAGTSGLVGEESAKAAALTHAGVSSDQVQFEKCKLDWEDGRQVYEVDFRTQMGVEYDYEIDAASGAVLSADYDAGDAVTTAPPAGNQDTAAAALLEEAQVRQIALDRVPGATSSHVCQWEWDHDDCAYEGEILYGGCEYEFKIDARTGAVLEWSSEHHEEGHHHH